MQRPTHRGSAHHTTDAASEAVLGLRVSLDKHQSKSAAGTTAAAIILVLILLKLSEAHQRRLKTSSSVLEAQDGRSVCVCYTAALAQMCVSNYQVPYNLSLVKRSGYISEGDDWLVVRTPTGGCWCAPLKFEWVIKQPPT